MKAGVEEDRKDQRRKVLKEKAREGAGIKSTKQVEKVINHQSRLASGRRLKKKKKGRSLSSSSTQ